MIRFMTSIVASGCSQSALRFTFIKVLYNALYSGVAGLLPIIDNWCAVIADTTRCRVGRKSHANAACAHAPHRPAEGAPPQSRSPHTHTGSGGASFDPRGPVLFMPSGRACRVYVLKSH